MFGSRGRKIFRDVWARKSRTAMASIAIFIGVLGVVTLVSSNDLVISQLDKDLKEDEMAMQQVFVSVPSGAEVDNAAYIEMLEEQPGVDVVEGRAYYPITFDFGYPDYVDSYSGYVFSAWESFDETTLQPMRVTQGRYPVAGQHEIAVEKRMADRFNLGVGNEVPLAVMGSNGATIENWDIVGIIFQPYPSWGATGEIDEDEVIFATYEDAQAIAGFTGFSTFYLRYDDYDTAQAQSDNIQAVIGQETPYIPVFNYMDNPAETWIISVVKQVTDMLSILGLVAMIVAGFLVLNVINTIVVEQKRQIGVMKSLGATRWDNFVMYVGIALVYGVIGMIPGVILGLLLGSMMAQALDETAFTLIEGFNISAQGIIVGIVMGLAIPTLAAIIPVFFGTRVTILEAMTDVGIASDYGRGLITKLVTVLRFPILLRQAISNLTRKKGRLALTWFTLTLAVASFMGIFAVFGSMNKTMSDIYDAFGYEITAVPNEYQDFDGMQTIVEEVEGVETVYPAVGTQVGIEGYEDPFFETSQLSVIGFDPATDMFDLDYDSGTGWEGDPDREGIVLSSGVTDQLGKEVGDTVVLLAGTQPTEFEIIGIATFPFDYGFMEWRTLALLGGFLLDGEPAPNSLAVKLTAEDSSVDEVHEVIYFIKEALTAQGVTATYNNEVESAEEAAEAAMTFGMMFSIAAIVMAAVGAIGLLSTLSMSVFERQKEIGVMRSIGASSRTIASQFLAEGLLVGLSAWVIGVPLSYLLSMGLGSMLPFGMTVTYPPVSIVIGLVGMMVIATIASLWPSIGASRKTVSEILRYQ